MTDSLYSDYLSLHISSHSFFCELERGDNYILLHFSQYRDIVPSNISSFRVYLWRPTRF